MSACYISPVSVHVCLNLLYASTSYILPPPTGRHCLMRFPKIRLDPNLGAAPLVTSYHVYCVPICLACLFCTCEVLVSVLLVGWSVICCWGVFEGSACMRIARRSSPGAPETPLAMGVELKFIVQWRLLLLLLVKKGCSSFVWNSEGAVFYAHWSERLWFADCRHILCFPQ